MLDAAADGQTPLTLAVESGSFQVVMLVMDRMKAVGAPPPDAALRERMAKTFGERHTDAKNRLLQALRDWDRLAKKQQRPTGR